MTRTIHLGYFPWQIHFSSSHYSTIKHGFSYSTKCLPARDFTIMGPLWSSSIFTSYQPWKNNNESYLHQTLLGPLPKPLCYGSFFKGWHQWQPTLINKNTVEKNRDLWVPSSSLRGLLISLMESYSLHIIIAKWWRTKIPIPSRGESKGLLQWCLKAPKRKEYSQARILAT